MGLQLQPGDVGVLFSSFELGKECMDIKVDIAMGNGSLGHRHGELLPGWHSFKLHLREAQLNLPTTCAAIDKGHEAKPSMELSSGQTR